MPPVRRHCILRVILLLIAAATINPASSQATPADPVPLISAALRQNHFAEGLQLATAALRRTPHDPRIFTLQGIAYAGLQQPQKALASYRTALHTAPSYLPALQAAAQLEYTLHDPVAATTLARLLTLRPDDQTAHAMLGAIEAGRDHCEPATQHFALATQAIAAQPPALMQYSSCLVQLGRPAQAIPVLQQLQAQLPASPTIRYDLALTQSNAGQPAEALATLQPNLAATPTVDDLTLAADIVERQGDTQRALDLLRQAIRLDPRNRNPYLDFANLAYQHASVQVGLDIVNLGLKQLPDDAELHFARGVLLSQLDRLDQALADFDLANRLEPRLSFVQVAQGIAQSQAHQTSAALATFREQSRLHPTDPFAAYLLAEALFAQGNPPGSPGYLEEVEAATRSVRLDPIRADARNLLASIYLQGENLPGAIQQSEAVLAVDPKDQQALYHLILALRKSNQKDKLPALVTRLTEARREAEATSDKHLTRSLVEVPATETKP